MTTNGYSPTAETALLLAKAHEHTLSVPYDVTARWVFYRLLQDGSLTAKSDYKRLLGYLSKARKSFYGQWTPWTLTDDSRAARVRGSGFTSGQSWAEAVAGQVSCNLDRWRSQDVYVEVWFEAAANADPNITLLAFHGDVSIPEKWRAAERLARRWLELRVPIKVLYYGDLDDKGLLIPESARKDVFTMMAQALDQAEREFSEFVQNWEFTRMGLNDDQVDQYGVPENPERPGTYQWEGVDDAAAEELIGLANSHVDIGAFEDIEEREGSVTQQFKDHLKDLEIEE